MIIVLRCIVWFFRELFNKNRKEIFVIKKKSSREPVIKFNEILLSHTERIFS